MKTTLGTQIKNEQEADADELEALKINEALHTYAGIDTSDITIVVQDNHVHLSGTVDTALQKEDAEFLVWMCIPDLAGIDNRLRVNTEHTDEGIFEY